MRSGNSSLLGGVYREKTRNRFHVLVSFLDQRSVGTSVSSIIRAIVFLLKLFFFHPMQQTPSGFLLQLYYLFLEDLYGYL